MTEPIGTPDGDFVGPMQEDSVTPTNRPIRLGLALALVAVLVPGGTTVAQTDDTAAPTFTWTEVEGLLEIPQLLATTPDGADLLTTARFGEMGAVLEQLWWRSTDGLTWEPIDPPTREPVKAMAGGPLGVVALGTDREEALHFSPDGVTWERIRLPEKDVAYLESAVATPDGFVVVGSIVKARKKKRSTSFQYYATAWSSPDGRTWTMTRMSEEPVSARQVAASPEGLILAAGADSELGGRTWRLEADGSWTQIAGPAADVIDSPSMLRHAAGRFVVGDQSIGLEEAWLTTVDGSEWVDGPGRLPTDGRPIAAVDGVLFVQALEDQSGALLRWSPEWETWTESSVPEVGPTQFAYAVGTLASGDVLLVTWELSGDSALQPEHHIWVGAPESQS